MPYLPKIPLAIIMVVLFLPVLVVDAAAEIGPCQVFQPDNPWNMDVYELPVDPMSATYIANINAHGDTDAHPDFGENPTYGIPYVTVTNSDPLVPINYSTTEESYEDESDPGPYPIPPTAPIEGVDDPDGDRHVIVINTDTCMLYELYRAFYDDNAPTNSWTVAESVIWDLNSPIVQQRPLGWTSADAAGLPIFPGLARCDEAMSGTIQHAFRFTVEATREAYIYPASHEAGESTDPSYPPMGLRFRLKRNYDISHFGPQSKTIAEALKHYGMMIADNGSNWYISGETNPTCWDDDDLDALKHIPGTAFEVVSIISPPTQAATKNYFYTDTPTLTWTRITWATSYQLQISRSSTFAGEPILSSPTTSFETASLENGLWYWHVRATGGTTWSPFESFTVRKP